MSTPLSTKETAKVESPKIIFITPPRRGCFCSRKMMLLFIIIIILVIAFVYKYDKIMDMVRKV